MCTVLIATLWLDLWDQRKKDCHRIDASTKAVALQEQEVREIKILYTYQDKVLQMFTKDMALHIQGNTSYIRQWINTNQASILKSANNAKIKPITKMSVS
jgi:hypothetical protein